MCSSWCLALTPVELLLTAQAAQGRTSGCRATAGPGAAALCLPRGCHTALHMRRVDNMGVQVDVLMESLEAAHGADVAGQVDQRLLGLTTQLAVAR